MNLRLPSGALLFVGFVFSCNDLTGASGYASVENCTGSDCQLMCEAQGDTWDTSKGTCACPSGAPLCGGLCCGSAEPYCVTTSTGSRRCSSCTEAAYECGGVCCEQQLCLNPANGACGAPYGVGGQSCAGGLTCPMQLPDGSTQNVSCCDSIALPGGTFEMGLTVSGKNQCPSFLVSADEFCNADEMPAHEVTLSPFALDRFEVNVGRFRKFVDAWDYQGLPAGAGGDAAVAGSGWRSEWNEKLPKTRAELEADVECKTENFSMPPTATWSPTPSYWEDLPIVCVNWYEAFVFCAWDGGRLPTEAEWEYAAANGPAADLFPWGESEPTATTAAFACNDLPEPCSLSPQFPTYVGSHPIDANIWGNRDLAGNVTEWTLDSVSSYPDHPVTNYANTSDGFRMLRGAGIFDGPAYLRASARSSATEGLYGTDIGFRCARAP
jgi:formylglycine-generating enzyme